MSSLSLVLIKPNWEASLCLRVMAEPGPNCFLPQLEARVYTRGISGNGIWDFGLWVLGFLRKFTTLNYLRFASSLQIEVMGCIRISGFGVRVRDQDSAPVLRHLPEIFTLIVFLLFEKLGYSYERSTKSRIERSIWRGKWQNGSSSNITQNREGSQATKA